MDRHVIIDLGCARCVCGMPWLRRCLAALKAQNRVFKLEKTRETCRFGDGARVQSFLLAPFDVSFLGHLGTLSMCVVDRDCPPLFSRPGCTAVGMQIDCARHKVHTARLGGNRH